MTIELKTGKKGELHISSEDDRLLHCRSFGTGAYVLSGCAVTMTSVNKAHIAEGELMVQGGYVRITGGGEDVAIANGVAGQKRNTIIALTYTRDSNGIEAMSFAAVDGTSTAGTPSDPTVTTNDINAGASSSMWKFARIRLDGLTVGTPQVLFTTKAAALLDQISSLSSQVASLQDSVSPSSFLNSESLKITMIGKLAIVHANWLPCAVSGGGWKSIYTLPDELKPENEIYENALASTSASDFYPTIMRIGNDGVIQVNAMGKSLHNIYFSAVYVVA